MKDEKTIEVNGKLFTLDLINLNRDPDVVIRTDNDEVHRNLFAKATIRFGYIDDNDYIYLIDGRLIEVKGKIR